MGDAADDAYDADLWEDEEEPCGCADRVKPGQAYHCPICDADWPAEEDEAASISGGRG